MTRVLLIGSDRYFAQACVDRGVEVVAVRNASVMRNGVLTFPEEARQVLVADQTDTESVVSGLAHAGLTLADFDGVYTNFEFAVVLAASLAEAAGLPGPGTDVAVLMRDKYLQKQRLARAGVSVPRSQVFWSPPTPAEVETLGFPLVLKPVAGIATEATTLANDPDEFERAVASFYSSNGAQKALLVEQFVAGEEFVLDGWVHDGLIGFSSLGRYALPCLETVTTGSSLRVYRCTEVTHPGLAAAATGFAGDALTALGMRNGVFHLEFFRTEDGRFVFGECGARRGGGFTEEVVRLSRSTSLAEASLDLCLGARPQASSTEPVLEVGEIQPKLPGGVVLGLPQIGQLASLEGVEYVRYFTYLGATSAGVSTASDQRAAGMLVGAPTVEELDARLDQVEKEFVQGAVVSPNTSPRHMREFQVEVLGREDLRYRPYALAARHDGHGKAS
ncbi:MULTISPECIES: ATP-grasp domain-containing protein [unclassified Streptomyces]|uniref:ATP-grasp domain-containing protein n=1 Tax=unclassified Streptomyces TaxID=2593676 RepID=UPI002252C633|nr:MULTISPECIES: ATP-grasp domain-containing protein [unclassified Streptomyces]MCX5054606.1 ATP-grasp domain-containing protein [Streptomyces sp. NBC_00474]